MSLKENTLLIHCNNDCESNTGLENFKLCSIIIAQSKTKKTDTFQAV